MNNPSPRAEYRLLLAVDIGNFSGRSGFDQLILQTRLRFVLETAAEHVGLDRFLWITEPRGDGELAILPADVDVGRVVGEFPPALEWALGEFNRGETELDRLRLRLAIHYGLVAHGPFGSAGEAAIVVTGMVNSRQARESLKHLKHGDLALVISGRVYDDVVRGGFCVLQPAGFRLISIHIKKTRHRAYMLPAPVEEEA